MSWSNKWKIKKKNTYILLPPLPTVGLTTYVLISDDVLESVLVIHADFVNIFLASSPVLVHLH